MTATLMRATVVIHSASSNVAIKSSMGRRHVTTGTETVQTAARTTVGWRVDIQRVPERAALPSAVMELSWAS